MKTISSNPIGQQRNSRSGAGSPKDGVPRWQGRGLLESRSRGLKHDKPLQGTSSSCGVCLLTGPLSVPSGQPRSHSGKGQEIHCGVQRLRKLCRVTSSGWHPRITDIQALAGIWQICVLHPRDSPEGPGGARRGTPVPEVERGQHPAPSRPAAPTHGCFFRHSSPGLGFQGSKLKLMSLWSPGG